MVREALRPLKYRDESLAQFRGDIQAGLDQIARGDYTEFDRKSVSKLAARVKARGRKRLAASTARYYRLEPSHVLIARVLHGSRDQASAVEPQREGGS